MEQNLHNITRLYTILPYQVSNEQALHGWVQKKTSNNGTPRWPEKAVLEAFSANSIQKEYPNVLSQKGKSCPPRPRGVKAGGDRPICPRAAGVPGTKCINYGFVLHSLKFLSCTPGNAMSGVGKHDIRRRLKCV